MYACTYVCVYVCVCMYICVCICVCVCMYIYVCACVCVCNHDLASEFVFTFIWPAMTCLRPLRMHPQCLLIAHQQSMLYTFIWSASW